jgi:hypothetical protein
MAKKITGADRMFGVGFFWQDKIIGGKRVLLKKGNK